MSNRLAKAVAAATVVLGIAHGLCPAAESTATVAQASLRAPATPLVTCDPYFSVWSQASVLTDADTTHWTGKPHRLTSLATIDGKPFRVMGREPSQVPPLEQLAVEIQPTQTSYKFAGGGVEISLTFTTPALPEDIDLLSRPITYLTYTARSTDGTTHDVRLYFEASGELTVNTPDQLAAGAIEMPGDLIALKMGSQGQQVLRRKGDDVRIEWGYLYLAAQKTAAAGYALGEPPALRTAFLEGTIKRAEGEASPARGDALSAAITFDLPKVGPDAASRWLVLAYDDLYSIEYMGSRLKPFWRRNGLDAAGLLTEASRDYKANLERCTTFDKELTADLTACGGEKYAAVATMAYRQCFAAGKFVADANGQALQFCKENHSNGCIGTSDVFYPMAPQFFLFGPSLAKSFLVPFMNYAASDRWKFPFAPHDLGTYPKANGQVYGGGERTEENQMPVEESGNLLLLMTAVAKMEGNASFAERYWPRLEAWAKYLKAEGFDPANQLCTDDFAGHLAHNVNLSAKAICALGAYSELCKMRGDEAQAAEYRKIAEEFAARWVAESGDGDHSRLTFDRADTWSQKYNLVWDRLLDLKLFPDDVYRKEMDYYRSIQNRYGLPLDNRSKYTKLDWILWTATLTQNREDFEALVEPVFRFLNDTPDRSPMTDWYFTDSGRKRGFTARPVVGGVFMQVLFNDPTWKKWASRDRTKSNNFAPMPKPPVVTAVVPAADTEPATWRYSTSQPEGEWTAANFDDSAWAEGRAGFGSRGTPGARIGRRWTTPDIWIRRKFDIGAADSSKLQLYVNHDEDAEIYINGVLAAKVTEFNGQYEAMPMSDEARATLKPTGNTIAIHCKQTQGGQYIDAGLVIVTPGTP